MKFEIEEWRSQVERTAAADWKEAIYFFLRPLLNLQYRRHLSPETLQKYRPNLVLGERGMPLIARRKRALRGASLQGKTVIVQGTGNGADLYHWAKFKPQKIIGLDLFEFDSWASVKKTVEQDFGCEVEFHVSSLTEMNFLEDETIDMCVSDAVFEHVQDPLRMMLETRRVLKKQGIVYAGYGPLWFGPGGDHFSGRDGALENVYNHIRIENDEYMKYYQAHKKEVEDFQSGGRYIEIDLFSKLHTDAYFDVYKETGFKIDDLIFELSGSGIAYKDAYPSEFQAMQKKYVELNADDFLIKAHFIRLSKE